MKNLFFISLGIAFASFFGSCQHCEMCHQVKVYDDAPIGAQKVIQIKESCTRKERRQLKKQDVRGADDGGPFRTFWTCDLLVDKSDD